MRSKMREYNQASKEAESTPPCSPQTNAHRHTNLEREFALRRLASEEVHLAGMVDSCTWMMSHGDPEDKESAKTIMRSKMREYNQASKEAESTPPCSPQTNAHRHTNL